MGSITIQGRVPLQGTVVIQGSKNAALPILAAGLLTSEESFIGNCPHISDVSRMLRLMKSIGCEINRQTDGYTVDASRVSRESVRLTGEAVAGMRSSICLLGALVGICGEVIMEPPGGCAIGARPIDMHIEALTKMGVTFSFQNGMMRAVTPELHGADIRFGKKSVGATENCILAAVSAEGKTTIQNAATEPEVSSLCHFLTQCGAEIEGIGTEELTVYGGKKLYGTRFTVPADRIVAGTYLMSCIGTGGDVFLEQAPAADMTAVILTAARMGGKVWAGEEGIYVQGPIRPLPVPFLKTGSYPEFPTDLQSVLLAVETVGDGETVIEETVFENRFRIADDLNRMGAKIEVCEGNKAIVQGVPYLKGANVTACELRGGAALVTAGLMARGKTVVNDSSFIYRGYENICRDFRELGARIISG